MKTYLSVSNLLCGAPVGIHGVVVPDVAGGSNGEYEQEENEDLPFYLLFICGVPDGIHGAVVPDVAGGSNGKYKQEEDEVSPFY